MLHHSNMTAEPSSPIVPLMYVSSVDVPPTWPDEDGTKGGKVLAAVPPMRPDEDPTGGCARQTSVPPIRPDDDPQPITERGFPPEGPGPAGGDWKAAFLLDALPTWPEEDSDRGGKRQASVPPLRPDDDPIGDGSRQSVLPEDPAAGGEDAYSFFDTLVQANVAPVLRANPLTNPFQTGEIDFEEWLAVLETRLAAMARTLYQRWYTVNAMGPEDLVQEARIAIWRITDRYNSAMSLKGFQHYCLRHAYGAMINALQRMNHAPAISLDEYLCGDHGIEGRDIADTSAPARKTSLTVRRRVLAALRRTNLTLKERLAVMTWYRIETAKGHCYQPEHVMKRLRCRPQALYDGQYRALVKLSHDEQLRKSVGMEVQA